MRICGIIAEYNPLHNGHVYQIEQAKKLSKCDALVVALSGSFVQRGETAAYNKFERAKWAIQAGADIVYEIPTTHVLQGASGFALGGVSVLRCAGANSISFGSEVPNLSQLQKAATVLLNPSETFSKTFLKELATGKSYPRSLSLAASSDETLCQIAYAFEKPNFMLGVEYLKAMQTLNFDIEPIIIERIGEGYNSEKIDNSNVFSSATAIRKIVETKNEQENFETKIRSKVPPFVFEYIAKNPISKTQNLETVLLYCLRSAKNFENIFGVEEGFENVLKKAANACCVSEIFETLKSKRYTLARIRRILCCVMLNSTKEFVSRSNKLPVPYLRILAMKKNSDFLLKVAKNNPFNQRNDIKIIGSKKDADALSPFAKQVFEKDVLATNIANLAFGAGKIQPGNIDYTNKFLKV